MKMSLAIKFAAGAVSAPIGQGTSWTVVGPYYTRRLDGPYTEVRATSYAMALHIARQWRIGHALGLMGFADDDGPEPYPSGDWRTVARQIARQKWAARPPVKVTGSVWGDA